MYKIDNKNNNKILSQLPLDLVNMILEYLNVIVYRNGKYIDRINKSDTRYELIDKIPKPIKINNNQYYIGLREKGRKVIKISLNYLIQHEFVIISTCENYVGRNGMIYTSVHRDNVFI